MTIEVIDISGWQHPGGAGINWTEVKASGVAGVIIKATQNTNYTNPYWKQDAEGALAAGLLIGAYHYAVPGGPPPAEQASYFHSVASEFECALGYWLDLEQTDGRPWAEVGQWAKDWVDAVGTPAVPAGVYCNISYWDNIGYILTGIRMWIAAPYGQEVPAASQAYVVQEGIKDVPGIEGGVDWDTWFNVRALNPNGGSAPKPVTPAGPVPWTGTPSIAPGATGPDVQWVQGRLREWGHDLTADGIFGAATEAAVRDVQGTEGLAVDGVVGPATYAKLAETPSKTDPNVEPVSDEPELKSGSTGVSVRYAQSMLNSAGAGITVDGDFGPATETAVKNFQTTHGLAVDGVIGPLTWAKLG